MVFRDAYAVRISRRIFKSYNNIAWQISNRSYLKVNVHHRIIRTIELEVFLFAIEKTGDVRSVSVIS